MAGHFLPTSWPSVLAVNLPPGSMHTVNVLATDAAGHLSRPSAPLTFTAGSPRQSTCVVGYQVTAGWGNGFVAAVTLTNLGPNPIDGWSLDFDRPAAGQSVTGAWNAKVTGSSGHVHATRSDGNTRLAANAP